MEIHSNPNAQKLLESFFQFKKLHWNQSPIIGLKPSEIGVMFCIKDSPSSELSGIMVSEVSRKLKVAPPTVTQLINRLEQDGFVERNMDKDDRRAVRVKLTEKGLGSINKARDVLFSSFNGLVEYLGEEESNELSELLTKVFTYFLEKKNEFN